MLLAFAVLLLFVPAVFQYIVGKKALNKTVRTTFLTVCLFSFALQLILTIVSFSIAIEVFSRETIHRCGYPPLIIILLSFPITIVMAVMMAFQYGGKKQYDTFHK